MAYLYKHTALQQNFNVNLTCLIPTADPQVQAPSRVGLREVLRHFLDFRLEVVTRRLARRPISGSWVTTTRVIPDVFNCSRSATTSLPAC